MIVLPMALNETLLPPAVSFPSRSTFSPASLAYASPTCRRCSRSLSTVATIPKSSLAICWISAFLTAPLPDFVFTLSRPREGEDPAQTGRNYSEPVREVFQLRRPELGEELSDGAAGRRRCRGGLG